MPTLRIVAGSYEHNLLCVALTFGKTEVFTPIFHFTPHTQSIRSIAWSRRTLVSGANDEHIRLYDLQNRKELGTLMHHQGQILCLQFYKNKWLFSGSGDGNICLWRTKDWELLAELKAHKAPVLDLSVHASGKIMLSIGEDRKLVLWNLMTARKASIRKLKATPLQVSFVPDSTKCIIAYSHNLVLYGSNGNTVREWKLPAGCHRVQWYNKLLAASTDDGQITFYDLEKDEAEFALHGHATRVKDFAVLDNFMASVSSDGNIVVWDLEKRDQIAVYNSGDRLNCVALIPDEVEKLKRPAPEPVVESDLDEEEVQPVVPKKKKKARVVVEEG